MRQWRIGKIKFTLSFHGPVAGINYLPFGQQTRQWKLDHLKMNFLLKMWIFHCHVSLLEGMFLCRFLDLSLNTCCTNLTKHAPFPLPGWQSPSCRLCEHRRCGPDQWWVLGSTPHAGCNAVVNLQVFGWDSVVKHGNIPGGHSMGLGGRSSVSLCLGEKNLHILFVCSDWGSKQNDSPCSIPFIGNCLSDEPVPTRSMYGIFTYIYL